MTRIELCRMCNEYSADTRCEFRETCKLQKILTDNAKLKAENKELKIKAEKLESDASWDKFPDMMGK